MCKIKIICDPYKKENLFQVFNPADQKWNNINIESNPNSKLLSDDFRHGFFPFVADRIIKEIINEYSLDDEQIKICFEGTDDDFDELKQVCHCLKADNKIILEHGDTYLRNANGVLQDIINIFKELKYIIDETKTNKAFIENNLNKFSDVTNEIIPLCIMGNYSAGKSTFINALIGNEILPSGDEPVTAKVFKITQSENDDVAYIKMKRDNDFVIMFLKDGYEFVGAQTLDPLLVELSGSLEPIKNESLTKRINQALSIINRFDGTSTPDLIEIVIPFYGKLWQQSHSKFVILDTPGSNSATNADHLEVLENALAGLTNGLTIYVSEYDSLDSMDNKSLYNKLKAMPELDSRFTFIVVNKADENDLPESGYFSHEKEDEILNYTIPKNLYTEGIFFVSSILGLGAKTNGKFISKHLNRIYRKTKFMFDDPEDEDYTVLYRYNIMPKQLKQKILDNVILTQEDLVYVNSGLYSVEQEILNFAEQYASYNKCKQSTMYLDYVINAISQEIKEVISKREKIRKNLKDTLEKDKLNLIEQIQLTSQQQHDLNNADYHEQLMQYVQKIKPSFDHNEIKLLEVDYNELQKEKLHFENKESDIKDSFQSLKTNLKEGMDGLLKNKNINSLRDIGKTFVDNVKDTLEELEERQTIIKTADQTTSKLLLDKINADYEILSSQMLTAADEFSKEYWTQKTEDIKVILSRIITGSTALSDDKRTELANIIMAYQDIVFEQYKDISFELKDFLHGIKLGNFILYESDKLNIRKVVSNYNRLFDKLANEAKNEISKSHGKTFDYWLEDLLAIIVKNIVNYSPILSEKQKDIDEETNKIHELEQKLEKIKSSRNFINHIMDWYTRQ